MKKQVLKLVAIFIALAFAGNIAAQEIGVNPVSFDETATNCDGVVNTTLTIENTGGSDLTWEIYAGYGIVQNNAILVIQEKDSWGLYMNDFLISNFGITPTVITSNQIATTDFMQYDIVITSGSQSTTYYNNLSNNVAKFEDFVNAGGIVQYQLGTQGADVAIVDGVNVLYGNKENYNTNLMPTHPITKDLDIDLYGNNSNHCYITNLPAVTKIIAETKSSNQPTIVEYTYGAGLVIATGMVWEHQYMNNYNSAPLIYNSTEYCISLIGGVPSWLTLSSYTGTISAASTENIDLEFNATGYKVGEYNSNIKVLSNDPNNPEIIIPVTFTIDGDPIIELSESNYDFGEVFENGTNSEILTITNTGCDTLFITDILSSNSDYTVNQTVLEVFPFDSEDVLVSFTPTSIGTIDGVLTIYNNDANATIDLTGVGIEAPVMVLTPEYFSEMVTSCGAVADTTLKIKNIGGNNLEFNISYNDGGYGWLNYNISNGTIIPNDSIIIDVDFDAGNLEAGEYHGDIFISSNDPLAEDVTIHCVFAISGTPTIELSDVSFDYGDVFLNDVVTNTLTISNLNCDTLFITDIVSELDAYTTDRSNFFVLPFDSEDIEISFAPAVIVQYNSELTIKNNDVDVIVTLAGNGISSPVAAVYPSEFNEKVTSCNGVVNTLLSIENTGGNDLEYEITGIGGGIGGENGNTGDVLGTFSNFSFSNTGMVWVNQYLYVVNYYGGSLVKYNAATEQAVASYSIHNSPFGIAFDGEYLYVTNSGGTVYKYNLEGTQVGSTFRLPFSNYAALTWDGEYLIAANAFYSATPIYRVDRQGSVIETFTSNLNFNYREFCWVPNHSNGELWIMNSNNNKFSQAKLIGGEVELVNSIPFTFRPNNPYGLAHDGTDLWIGSWDGPLVQVEDGIDESSWIKLSSYSGITAPDKSKIIDVEFNSENLNAGVHEGKIIINTNDPVNSEIIVPVTFTVEGDPEIYVEETTLLYGDVLVNESSTRSLYISNTGCDTLKITNVTSSLAEYMPDLTSFIVMPGTFKEVVVTFAPTVEGDFNGTITVNTNAGDIGYNLTGTGVAEGSPVITSTVQSLSFGEVTVGTSSDLAYSISASNLTENLVIVAPTDFEISLSSGSGFSNTITLAQTDGEVAQTTIYVKFSPTEVKTYAENITNSSLDATQVDIALTGIGIPPPVIIASETTLDFGNVIVNNTFELSYNISGMYLTDDIVLNAPNGYEISTTSGSDYANTLTLTQTDGLIGETTIYVKFAPVSNQSYNGTINHSSVGAEQVDLVILGNGVPQPVLSIGSGDINFGDVETDSFAGVGYFVSGSNLLDDITVTAPLGYGVSLTDGSGYTSSIVIPHSGGTISNVVVYVRFSPTEEQDYIGTITHTSTQADQYDIAVTGTGIAPPVIETVVSSINFGDVPTDAPAEQNYAVSASGLTTDLVINAPAGYSVSLTQGSGYLSSLSIVPTNGIVDATIYVQFAPTLEQTYSGNITHTSTGADQVDIAATGIGVASGTSVITKSISSFDFGDVVYNTISGVQNYTIQGANLAENILVTAPTGFEISLDNSDFSVNPITLTQTGGAVDETTIYVRFAPVDAIVYSGSITHASVGATSADVSVMGNGVCEEFIVTDPGNQNVCLGSTATLTVEASGSGTLTYVWKKGDVVLVDENNISGSDTKTLTITGMSNDDVETYTCEVTDYCVNTEIVEIDLNIQYPVQLNRHPSSTTACDGERVVFTVGVTGSNLTYQWKKDGENVGVSSSTYSIPVVEVEDAGDYSCVISGVCGNVVTSNAASLTVNESVKFTTQPIGGTLCEGETKTFTVVASGEGDLLYQWKRNGVDIENATSATYVISELSTSNAGNYTCVVTGDCGSVTSELASLDINKRAVITTQPNSTIACEGNRVTINVVATYATSYQWKKGGTDIDGATTASFVFNSALLTDAGSYTCEVSNNCNSVLSEAATLAVNNSTQITEQPTDVDAVVGEEVIFSVTATGSNLSYQWRYNFSSISEANESSLSLASVEVGNAGYYDVVVSGDCGKESSEAAILSVSTSIGELAESGINIYPNPSNGIFNIDYENDLGEIELVVLNHKGQVVYQEKQSSVKSKIDLSNQAQGIYIINFIFEDKNLVSRIVIE